MFKYPGIKSLTTNERPPTKGCLIVIRAFGQEKVMKGSGFKGVTPKTGDLWLDGQRGRKTEAEEAKEEPAFWQELGWAVVDKDVRCMLSCKLT